MTTPTHPNHVTDRQGFPCTLLWNLLPITAFSTSCLPEVIAILQTCSKEPSTPSLPFSLPTRDQSPGPRSNSRKDVSMAILFWVTFQNLSQGTDSHKAKQCPSKMN